MTRSTASEAGKSSPIVSVIVPVYDVEPWLRQCLDSVVEQTIDFGRLELIAVDDGSTDGSGTILDEYAARYPNVVVSHEPNSGGAGRPRNLALARATGTYVFFLDADDYLGVEALERMVAMAERNGSDIVLGKIVGVEGRPVRRQAGAFRRDEERVDLERVYRSANVLKLFRRAFLERIGMRFPEGVIGGEDGDVMAKVYLEAGVISVVAEYDCYYTRQRPVSPGDEPERRDNRLDYFVRLEEQRIAPVAAQRRGGLARDVLLLRHIRKLLRKFNGGWLRLPPAQRREVFEAGAAILARWHSTMMDRALPAWASIRAYCLQHGLFTELEDVVRCRPETAFRTPIVERGRIYARYPHFRDGSGIPDRCFNITREVVAAQRLDRAAVVDGRLELGGEAYLALVGGTTVVELRRWPRGTAWTFEVEPRPTPDLRDRNVAYPMAGYRSAIELATAAGGRPLPRGTWSVRLSVGIDVVRRSVPIRVPRRGGAATPTEAPAFVKGGGLRLNPARELRLRVGRPSAAERVAERMEAAYRGVVRLLARGLSASHLGRLLEMGIEKMRPGMATRLIDD